MSNKTLSSRGRQEAQSKRAGRFRGSSINLFYLPAVILLAVFIVYPLFSGIGLSLTNWDGYSPEKGAGAVLLDSSLIPSLPIMPQDRARVDGP